MECQEKFDQSSSVGVKPEFTLQVYSGLQVYDSKIRQNANVADRAFKTWIGHLNALENNCIQMASNSTTAQENIDKKTEWE